ncbi:MAG: tetratricopeptide repeat protein, partial [Chlorobi bacterium]|nr:tetratricopeptide repeat protein [Chlorobiota bacterium]
MKRLFYIIIFFSTCTFGQNNIIDKVKSFKSPTRTIIYIDSILFYGNNELNNNTVNELLYLKALAFQENNNDKKALELFDKILSETTLTDERYANILLYQSNSNVKLNNIALAVEQALKAKEIAAELNSNGLKIAVNNALSFIYYKNNQYQKALQYLLNSVKLQEEDKDSIRLSAAYNNIAIIYKNTGNFKKALEYNNKSLEINLLTDNYVGISKSYSNIGRVYDFFGYPDKALEYNKSAIKINSEYKIKNSIPYRNVADIYLAKKEYNEAKKYYLQALEIEKQNKNNRILSDIYDGLLKIALQQNKFNEAFKIQNKADSLKHLILQEEYDDKLLQIKHQNQLYQKNKELQHLKLVNTKNRIILFISFGLTFLTVLLWLLKNKTNRLKAEKEKIMLEQKILRSQMNPHFIFNALSAIQNTLLDNEPIKSASYLSKFAKLIRQNFDFINEKSILLSEEIDALVNYMETQKMRFQNKFDYEINIFPDVDIYNVEIPPLLLQPFIE